MANPTSHSNPRGKRPPRARGRRTRDLEEHELTARPRPLSDRLTPSADGEAGLSIDADDLGAHFLTEATEQGSGPARLPLEEPLIPADLVAAEASADYEPDRDDEEDGEDAAAREPSPHHRHHAHAHAKRSEQARAAKSAATTSRESKHARGLRSEAPKPDHAHTKPPAPAPVEPKRSTHTALPSDEPIVEGQAPSELASPEPAATATPGEDRISTVREALGSAADGGQDTALRRRPVPVRWTVRALRRLADWLEARATGRS